MANHTVLIGPVEHNGATYLEGEELSLASEMAADLVAIGVVGVAQAAKPKPAEQRS